MICSNGHCRRPADRYAYGINGNRRVALLCDPCRDHLQAIGMDLRPERRDDPNRSDRNPGPLWLRNRNKAKDMTGGLIA